LLVPVEPSALDATRTPVETPEAVVAGAAAAALAPMTVIRVANAATLAHRNAASRMAQRDATRSVPCPSLLNETPEMPLLGANSSPSPADAPLAS
jgi:hypothetical protein